MFQVELGECVRIASLVNDALAVRRQRSGCIVKRQPLNLIGTEVAASQHRSNQAAEEL